MRTDQNHFVASCYVSERNRSTEGAHNHSNQNLPDDLRWQIPLLKPHASGFACNLKRDDICVNRKNYVVLLTVDKPESWKLQHQLRSPAYNQLSESATILNNHIGSIFIVNK